MFGRDVPPLTGTNKLIQQLGLLFFRTILCYSWPSLEARHGSAAVHPPTTRIWPRLVGGQGYAQHRRDVVLVVAPLVQLGVNIVTTKFRLSLDAGTHSRLHIRPSDCLVVCGDYVIS